METRSLYSFERGILFILAACNETGENQELASVIGLLHNYYYYQTGVKEFPGPNSADTVRPILRKLDIFTKQELVSILRAIFYQADSGSLHGPHDEILKDAYLLHLYIQNPFYTFPKEDVERLRNLLCEFAIAEEFSNEIHIQSGIKFTQDIDKRNKLADIAETLGRERVNGVPDDHRFQEICKYWPDDNIYSVLLSNWCAAFVYYCCMQAGFQLPIRYPNAEYRLAGVGALLDWTQLPETDFLYFDGQNGFIPQRGDIVIYDKLLTDHLHDHIGIVLACDDREILVAEGNRDNQNYSSVFYRDRWQCVFGYIRIENDYKFHFSGDYNPFPADS